MAPAEAPATSAIVRRLPNLDALAPNALLIRQFLARRAPGALELIEDADLPHGAAALLALQGVALCEQGAFFSHDRRRERAALIVAARKQASPSASARKELAAELYEYLIEHKRSPRDFRLIVAGGDDFLASYLGRYEALLAVVWRPERPVLERPLAPPVTPIAAFQKLRLSDAAVASGQLLPFEKGVELAGQASLRRVAAAKAPSIEQSPAAAAPIRSSEESRSVAEEGVHPWGSFEYRIVGRTRGRMQRRFFVRKDAPRLAVAMAASASALRSETCAEFFERVHTADDSIVAHKAHALELARREIATLSLELYPDGRFRCLAAGATPVFFRIEAGRALLVPDSSLESETLRIVEGRFHKGDALLLAPGRITSAEQRELVELAQRLQQQPAELAPRLAAWLDWRERGRSLLFVRNNSD